MLRFNHILAVSLFLTSSAAMAEQLHSYFEATGDGGRETLVISPCDADETAECVAHTLQCERDGWPALSFTIISGPVEKVAQAMIAGTEGQPRGSLNVGGVAVDLQFSTVYLDANEMDGGWILTAGLTDPAAILDSVVPNNSEDASLTLGGETFSLAPERGDGPKLARFVEACRKLQ